MGSVLQPLAAKRWVRLIAESAKEHNRWARLKIWRNTHALKEKWRVTVGTRPCCTKFRQRRPPCAK
jgi:hypothetical protein